MMPIHLDPDPAKLMNMFTCKGRRSVRFEDVTRYPTHNTSPPKKNDQIAIINICLYTYIAADILSEYALFIHPGSLHNMCTLYTNIV